MTATLGSDPALDLLTGQGAGELVAAVLAAAGGTPQRWSASHVDHQPGRGTTVSYRVRVCWRDGSVTSETLGAVSGRLPDGVARLSDGRTEIGMWRFPFDPDLPGLPAAADPRRLRPLLAGTGLAEPVAARVRAYRPRRRAVLEVTTGSGQHAFVKVVRPERARGLHELHRAATAAGCPVPESLGWSEDGLVLLAALPGRPLRDELLAGNTPPPAAELADLLDRLPATGPRRPTWGSRAGHYARVLAAADAELGARATAVAEAVTPTGAEGPLVPVHGDFYEAQLMVRDGRVGGLLDLDTLGRGERLDDAGCLLAHLALLACLHPERAAAIEGLARDVRARFTAELDPAALDRRVAAVLLSLATGPHRVQAPGWREATRTRLSLAERFTKTVFDPSECYAHSRVRLPSAPHPHPVATSHPPQAPGGPRRLGCA